MNTLTASVLVIGGALMPLLGLTAHLTMDKIAAYALPFFRQEPMGHAVAYFSLTNLKGAAISITIGALVFTFAGMKWLTKKVNGEELYRDVWPRGLDLEDALYRPTLRLLSDIGGAAARLVETAGALVIYGTMNFIFLGAKNEVIPPEDEQFSVYGRKSERSRVERSFSADLLYAACGVLALLGLAAWNMLK